MDIETTSLSLEDKTTGRFDGGRELLKWIAVLTMTIDHIGVVIYPEYTFLRIIGRLSFPLFSYLLVLGVKNTRNVRHYFTRLFLFALISQVPFYLASGIKPYEGFNIFFTLSFGVLAIHLFKKRSILTVLPVLAALFLNFDYSFYGILLIICLDVLDNYTKYGVISILVLSMLFMPLGPTQLFSLCALPIILLYKNGSLKIQREVNQKEKYPVWRKYFFYIYYPLHLTVLYLMNVFYQF